MARPQGWATFAFVTSTMWHPYHGQMRERREPFHRYHDGVDLSELSLDRIDDSRQRASSSVEIAGAEALQVECHVVIALRANCLHDGFALRHDRVEICQRYLDARCVAVVTNS